MRGAIALGPSAGGSYRDAAAVVSNTTLSLGAKWHWLVIRQHLLGRTKNANGLLGGR
jgi:hypothetical protein